MIDKEGNARIMDFGIARSVKGKGITAAGMMIGTPEYMSPEQVEGKEVDQRSDIYSLGVNLYEMVTGQVPFEGDTPFTIGVKHKSETPKDPRELNSQIPEDLSRVILKCMEKDKEKRYQGAGEVRSALDRVEKGIPLEETLSKTKSLFFFLKERKIIRTLAAFIGGGWLILEIVHWILINHYHFPEEILDIAIVTLLCALVCTLIWRFFGGIERKQRKVKIEYIVIPVIILITAFFDIQLVQKISISEEEVTREVITPTHKQLTFIGNASYPAISPDGKFIAYVIERIEANTRKDSTIFVQDIVSGQDIEVSRVYSCQHLEWLPDSSELSFSAITLDRDSGIFVISPLGGTPRRLTNDSHSYAWLPDSSQYVWVEKKQIHITSRSTGETTSMNLNLNESILKVYDIDWSPEGSFMLITAQEKDRKFAIWTISADGRKQSKVFEDSVPIVRPSWSPRGDAIYYLQQKDFAYQCWKIPVSLNTGEQSKAPLPILPAIHAGRSVSVSKNGKVLVSTRESRFTNLWLASIEGTEKERTVKTKQLTTGTFTDIYPSISPDGNFIVFSRGIFSKVNIYIMPLEGGSPRQITNFESLNLLAKWSPDGKEIAFGSNEGGTPRVWKVNVKGGSPFQFINTKLSARFDLAWSPGPNIIYRSQSGSNFNVLNPITEEESPLLKEDLDSFVSRPRYSPDGKKVAYEQSGGLWVVSLENSSTALLKEGNFSPIGWSSDGKWIYVSEPAPAKIKILMISVENSHVKNLLSLPIAQGIGEVDYDRVSMTPDGKHFVFEAEKELSDVWMVENFDLDVK